MAAASMKHTGYVSDDMARAMVTWTDDRSPQMEWILVVAIASSSESVGKEVRLHSGGTVHAREDAGRDRERPAVEGDQLPSGVDEDAESHLTPELVGALA